MKKEIHYYKDSEGLPILSPDLIITHNETMNAIKNKKEVIHTYAISTLYFGDLCDDGYNIYLHENNKTLFIKEGYVEEVNRNIKKAHDIRKMWIGGSFENYFYK